MPRWYDLQPCDEEFFDSARYLYRYPMELPVPPEQVWEGMTGNPPLPWCRLLHDGRYTSERPYGVGTTRTVGVARGVLRLRERFFRWEEGGRQSFSVEQASLPAFRRFGEDYLLEPTDTGCRFTWTFALEPGGLTGPIGPLASPVNKLVFDSLARDTRRHFTAGP
ncbi:MAG: SRPBCC family protein [Micromonosporaceae bacterium]